jgi:PIN domain nuclease of toxin-antitoxin system
LGAATDLAASMEAYLDTNVAVRLSLGNVRKISKPARQAINRYQLRMSPMVLLELQFLFEIGRTVMTAEQTLSSLQTDVDLQLCTLSFADIARAACRETWTRDAFDRLIVAHARHAANAPLITADEAIKTHYKPAIW